MDATRTIECYERLKAKGPTGAAAVHPIVPTALTERTTHDKIPLIMMGYWRSAASDGRAWEVRVHKKCHTVMGCIRFT